MAKVIEYIRSENDARRDKNWAREGMQIGGWFRFYGMSDVPVVNYNAVECN